MEKQQLLNTRERIQDDLIALLSDVISDNLMTLTCQIVVDHFAKLIKETDNEANDQQTSNPQS